MSANNKQVAGTHYQGKQLQHWDLVAIYGWDYFQGQITKYLMRWRDKNGLEDLRKAQHFLEKYIEEVEGGRIFNPATMKGCQKSQERYSCTDKESWTLINEGIEYDSALYKHNCGTQVWAPSLGAAIQIHQKECKMGERNE